MPNGSSKTPATRRGGPAPRSSNRPTLSTDDDQIRFSRWAPWAVLVAGALVGLFVLIRMALEKHEVRRTQVTETAAPEVAPKPLPMPEHVFVEHIETQNSDAQSPTESLLDSQGQDCLACARRNGCLEIASQGGSCDHAVGMATGCGPGVTEKDICLKTLHDIFASKCAASMQETPCLCGTTDPAACLGGTAPPTGPILADYACDLGTTDSMVIQQKFVQTEYGVGRANALIQCAGGFDCGCFGN